MNTDNPLRVFTSEQLDSLDMSSLKRIKKEILLEFQLSTTSTITINGLELDKNSILEIFDEINQKLPLYLFIYKNQTLNTFLNLGNVALFTDNKTIDQIKNLEEYRGDIEHKIAIRLKPMIARLVMKPNYRELETINRFVNILNPALIDEAYSEAYTELKNHIDNLEEKYKTPFTNSHNTNFYLELGPHVSINFYQTFTTLPDIFKPLITQYCKWCYDNIVYESISREKQLHKYGNRELRILQSAAKIASNITNKEANLKIAKTIQDHLESVRNQSSSGYNPSVWTVLIAIFLCVRMVLLIGKCSNNSSNGSNNNNNINFKKIIEDSEKRIAEKKRTVFRDLSGEKKSAINAKMTSQRDFAALTKLKFDVDVLPNNYAYFYELIPEELAEKHKGKLWPVIMSFKHAKIKGSILKHRMRYDFKSASKFYPQDYNFRKPKLDRSLNLSIKRIPYSNFPLNGVLDRIDTKTEKVIQSLSFSITYEKNKSQYHINLKPSNKKLIIPKEYISNLNINEALEEKDKFTIAIKNINLLNNKDLSQDKYFTLNDVFAYTFKNPKSKYFPSAKILSDAATIKYFNTSEEDNTSYLELKSNNVQINFFLDFPTGIIKGMTMISSNYDASEIERMILFSSN